MVYKMHLLSHLLINGSFSPPCLYKLQYLYFYLSKVSEYFSVTSISRQHHFCLGEAFILPTIFYFVDSEQLQSAFWLVERLR